MIAYLKNYALICFSVLLLLISPAHSATKTEIDLYSKEALNNLYSESSAAAALAKRAVGILVFPKVYKAGMGIGGEYGEGKLIKLGKTEDYYNTTAASIGFQLGAQVKSQVLMFMDHKALESFQNSEGWEAGVDGSVAIATLGTGGEFDTETVKAPIVGFIFSNKGLMFNLTLEGSKFTKIKK